MLSKAKHLAFYEVEIFGGVYPVSVAGGTQNDIATQSQREGKIRNLDALNCLDNLTI
jgi:hypothetical protein